MLYHKNPIIKSTKGIYIEIQSIYLPPWIFAYIPSCCFLDSRKRCITESALCRDEADGCHRKPESQDRTGKQTTSFIPERQSAEVAASAQRIFMQCKMKKIWESTVKTRVQNSITHDKCRSDRQLVTFWLTQFCLWQVAFLPLSVD